MRPNSRAPSEVAKMAVAGCAALKFDEDGEPKLAASP